MRQRPVYLSDLFARTVRPAAKDFAIPDNRLSGFSLRIQPNGTRSWVLRLTIEGKTKRLTIGRPSTMSAIEARARAHQMLAAHAPPIVVALVREDRPGVTLDAVARRFMTAKAGNWKPTTLRAFRIYLNAVILPALGDRAVNRLTSADIAGWFHTYSATRPGGANQALAHLRSLLRFARETGLLPPDAADPSKPVRRNTRRARGRLLTVRQIERLGAWLSAPPLRWIHMADAIRLILLTGCRSGEIARLSWSEVFADRLKLASTKTGAREVFLTPPALVILNRKRRGASSKFVFPHPQDARRPVGSVDGSWRAIRALIGLPDDIRLHDLRHTYASHAIMTGETLDIAGRLLGHKKPQSTEIYAHLDGGHLADAADRVAAIIGEWLEGYNR